MEPRQNPEPNPRLQKIDKSALLAQCPLFAGLSPWELKSIAQLMRLVEFKRDEVVYREGGDGDHFYIVVSGRFEASVSVAEKKKILAYLRRGDYFGEMSLLTGAAHSATLRALSDSLTLQLTKDDFKKTIEHNATVSLELSRRLSNRLKGLDARERSLLKSDIVSIHGHQRRSGRTSFSINLAASLFEETRQKTILLDLSPSGVEVASTLNLSRKVPVTRFQIEGASSAQAFAEFAVKHPSGFEVLSVGHDPREGSAEHAVTHLLNHLAVDYRFILIDLPHEVDETVLKAISQSDAVLFVTDSNINNITETRDFLTDLKRTIAFPDERLHVVIQEVFYGIRTTQTIKRELFGKINCLSLPSATSLKEGGSDAALPLVIDEPDAEYSRVVRHLARRLSNNLVGLALGSGAALGLAHVGVLKVLERERIHVDMISGSSIGSLIGALYAIGKSAAEIEEAALEINSRFKLLRLLDMNVFPLRGLLHGDMVMRHFKKHLGNKTFDDCKIPLRVIGANLSTRQAITLDSGFITDAVRTSIAIPAIFKPTFIAGDVVVDGGILSPLPVRALHEAGANKVIAVNVFPTSKDTLEKRLLLEEAAEKEAADMRRKHFMARGLYKAGRRMKRGLSHNLFDVLMNTIQTMEAQIAETEGETADVLLRPTLPPASWVEFFKPRPFIRRGEEEAEKMLSKIKLLVTQQNV